MTKQEQLSQIQSLIEQTNQKIIQTNQQLNQINQRLDLFAKNVEDLKLELIQTHDRVKPNKKSSRQVANLAFSLIVATAAAIIIPTIFGR